MRKTQPFLYVLLPLLYVGIVFFLIIFQFSRNETFSRSVGDIEISGKSPTSGQQAEVMDFQLKAFGLQFSFSASRPVVLLGDDGVSRTARPVSWSQKKDSVEVLFQYQFKVIFEKTGEGGLAIRTDLPPELGKVVSLAVPFAPGQDVHFNHLGPFPLMEVVKGKKRLLVSLAGGQDTLSDDNVFHLSVHSGLVRPIMVEPLGENADPVALWLGLSPGTSPGTEAALKDYWAKAYDSWQTARFNADSLTWDMGDGTKKFYEPLVGAYLGESLAKGEYLSALAKVSSGNLSSASWGFQAMPYLGNMMETTQAKRRQMEVLSSKDQVDWASSPRLWVDARYYGTEQFTAFLEKNLLSGEIPKTTAARIAFLANLLTMKEAKPSLDGLDARIDSVLRWCLEGILRQDGNLYLLTESGWLDMRSSLVLGKLLLKHAALYKDSSLKLAGEQLISSALAQQDKNGFIPEILVLENGKVSRQEGLLRPEDLYSLISDRALAETPLGAPGWGPNPFIRTPAVLVSHEITAGTAKFSLQFPTGGAEHLIIQGIPPFDHLFLHGIRWRTDPDFQMYSDGWSYNSQTQTLYVKIKHKSDREDLVISFQP